MRRFVITLIAAGSLFTTAHMQSPSGAAAPLDARVTINYRHAAAADVLRALAAAAGLTLELGPGELRPVTITVTDVKLGTALAAVCENARCTWSLGGALRVTPIPDGERGGLPTAVSFDVYDTPVRDVFLALAAASGVAVIVDPQVSGEPVTLRYKNAAASEVLDKLCGMHSCTWTFDPTSGLRVTKR